MKFCFGLGRFFFKSLTTSAATFQFRFVLFTEAVSCREKVPTASLVHVPYIGLLAGVLRFILVDQVHKEKPLKREKKKVKFVFTKREKINLQVIGQIVFLLHMDIKTVWHTIQIIFANAADKTVVGQFVFHALHLISQSSKSVNDET